MSRKPQNAGNSLPLAAQLLFTDGYCEAFANALVRKDPDAYCLRKLVVCDPRYAARLDYPADAKIEAHVFALDAQNNVVDAEGRRPILDMLRSFGVRRGYSYTIEVAFLRLESEIDATFQAGMNMADRLIEAAGWDEKEIPQADGRLAKNFRAARGELDRIRARKVPEPEPEFAPEF